MRQKMRKKGRRGSVSAESGTDEDKNFVPPNIVKTDEERAHIKDIINGIIMVIIESISQCATGSCHLS